MTTENTSPTAKNTVVLYLTGDDGNRQEVASFEAGTTVGKQTFKSPKHALKAFIAADPDLVAAATRGALSYLSGHVTPIEVEAKPTITL